MISANMLTSELLDLSSSVERHERKGEVRERSCLVSTSRDKAGADDACCSRLTSQTKCHGNERRTSNVPGRLRGNGTGKVAESFSIVHLHSQVVVRVGHVGAVAERPLEGDLGLLHATPLRQHVGQISISCKKWQSE